MASKDNIIRETRRVRGSSGKIIRYYEARCNNQQCTNLTYKDVYSYNNWSGFCKKCSDLIKINNIDRSKNPTIKEEYLALYNSFIKTCKEKKKENTLSFEEFKTFTEENECHYCNSPIYWTKNNLSKHGSRYNLDRVDNEIGYNKENCVACCWKCNNSKGNRYSYSEWYGMTEYFRKKISPTT